MTEENTNIFADLDRSKDMEETKDSLGGYAPLQTNVYPFTILLAYAGNSSSSKARSVTVHLKNDQDNSEYRETFWVTGKDDKNYYMADGAKVPLLGFVTMDDLCLMATGYPMANQTTEEKVVPLYDFEARKELPKNVYVITSILGHKILAAVECITENKTQKNPQTGIYEPIEETRDVNEIKKIFHAETKKTVAEYRDGKDATFHDKWVAAHAGKPPRIKKSKTAIVATRDKAGAGGRPAPSGATTPAGAKPAGSLFQKG